MRLENRVAIIVPGTIGDAPAGAEQIKEQINKALRDLSAVNGGATATPGQGAWVSDSGELVVEPVTVIESFTPTVSLKVLKTLVRLARSIQQAMEQEAVSVRVNDTLYIIS